MAERLRLFVLTGAGISAESGIPVFQGTQWRGHSHYDLANIDTWNRDPKLSWEYYSERRTRGRDAKPNPAHVALAELERSGACERFFLCTQNVDGLHEAAGSQNLVHIHGKIYESRCAQDCGRPAVTDYAVYSADNLPRCECGALMRPNVCLFGEIPFDLDRVFEELGRCNTFLAVGTSGSVQPVAGFVAELKSKPAYVTTIFVGLEEPSNAYYFDEVHLGKASELLPPLMKKLATTPA